MAAILGFIGGAVVGTASGGPGNEAEASNTTEPDDASGTDGATDEESPEASPESEDGEHTITLTADPTTVAAFDRIDLEGNLEPPVEGGVTLVVQRRLGEDGDWEPFGTDPVEAETRDDGSFSTWIETGREGVNEFRLVGEVDGEPVESETVTVTVEASDDDDDDDDNDD